MPEPPTPGPLVEPLVPVFEDGPAPSGWRKKKGGLSPLMRRHMCPGMYVGADTPLPGDSDDARLALPSLRARSRDSRRSRNRSPSPCSFHLPSVRY